jgi:hypothetical protein
MDCKDENKDDEQVVEFGACDDETGSQILRVEPDSPSLSTFQPNIVVRTAINCASFYCS